MKGEFCFGVVEMSTLNFLTRNSIFYVSNTIKLNIFHNHGGIYTFVKIFLNLWRDESLMGSIEKGDNRIRGH